MKLCLFLLLSVAGSAGAGDKVDGRFALLAAKVARHDQITISYFRFSDTANGDQKWLQNSECVQEWIKEGCDVRCYFRSVPFAAEPPSIEENDWRKSDALFLDISDARVNVAGLEYLIRDTLKTNPAAAVTLIFSAPEQKESELGALKPLSRHFQLSELEMAPQIAKITISGVLRMDEIYDDEAGLTAEGWRVYGSILTKFLRQEIGR